jgi:hypothetical protein
MVKGAKRIINDPDPIQRADELEWGNPEWDELKKILQDTSDGLCFSDRGVRLEMEMTRDGCAEAAIGLLVEQAVLACFEEMQERRKKGEEEERLKKMEEAEKEILAMVQKEEQEKKEKKDKEAEKK